MSEAALLEVSRLPAQSRKITFTSLVEDHARTVLAVYTVVYAIGVCLAASRKPLWFDEILTTWISTLPSLSDIWEAMRRSIQMDPPTFPFLMRILHWTLGAGPVVSRLPAAFGYWLMSVCVYHFIRRRMRPAYGFIALIFPIFTTASRYAIEARGYGLELGFASLALLSWQLASDGVMGRLPLAGIAVGTAGAVLSHYYGTYFILALATGEAVRSYVLRRIDWPCILAIAAGVLPVLAFSQLIVAGGNLANTLGSSPNLLSLLWFYFGVSKPALLLGFPFLTYMLGRKQVKEAPPLQSKNVLPIWELVTVTVLAAMPLVLYFAALFVHLGVWDRYLLLAVPGLTILLTSAFFQLFNGSALAADFVLKTALFFCLVPWLIFSGLALAATQAPGKQVQRQAVIPNTEDLKIVISNELTFLQQYFYLPPERARQICMLVDLEAATRYTGQSCGLRSVAEGRKWWPIPAYSYRKFIAQNHRFLVVRDDGPDWLLRKLIADGANLQLLEYDRAPGVSGQGTEIYRVTF